MSTNTVVKGTPDWHRVAAVLAHRLIAAGELERASADLRDLADWERHEGARWSTSEGHGDDAEASAALVRAYEEALALLEEENRANPFIRPRNLAPA